jgi:hypothetical protein
MMVLLGAMPAAAQSTSAPGDGAELVTDRPDFTESSQVMDRGWFQFESGVSYEGDGNRRSLTVPSALMRIGLGGQTELRIGADGLLSERLGGIRRSGHSDIDIGAKTSLLRQGTSAFDLAVIPMVSLPIGAEPFTSGGVDPTLKVTWGKDLRAGFGLTGNVNVSSLSGDATRFHQEAASVSLGHALLGGWSGYAEVYGFSRLERGERAAWTMNGGTTLALGNHGQFDLEAGRGLTAAAPDWFVGAGLAIRGAFGDR